MRWSRMTIAFAMMIALHVNAFGQEASGVVDFARKFLEDSRGLWTSPLHARRADVKWLVPLGISASVLLPSDRGISREVVESPRIQRPSNIISKAGSFPVFVAPAAMIGFGRLTKHEQIGNAGTVGLEAVLQSAVIVRALKAATNRERPSKLRGEGGFWDGGKSFPSGHAITSWALASAMADQYPKKKWVGIAGYGAATAIGLSRIGGQNHFASDVLVGSSLGWLIGHYVSRHHQTD